MAHDRARARPSSSLAFFAVVLGSAALVAHAATLLAETTRIDNPAPTADALFGAGVAGIGDVNGDGRGDLVVGAPGAEHAYVLSGPAGALLRTLSDPAGLNLRFGFSVAGVGDWTGDGREEIAVGAPGVEGIVPLPCLDPPCLDPNQGRVFVFSGADGALLRTFFPPEETLLFGHKLVSPGDLNGDGRPDLVVGAPVHIRFLGSVYAFSGADGSLLWKASEPGAGTSARQPIASFGQAIAAIGDLDGDGRPDLLVGAPFFDDGSGRLAGKLFVLSGRTGAVIRTHVTPSPTTENRFGFSVATLGDQDGDGRDDYAVGDVQAARVHLYGGASGASLGTLASPPAGSYFGVSLAAVGDHDGDGRNDLWVGALAPPAVRLFNRAGAELLRVDDPTPDASPPERAFGLALSATRDLGGGPGLDLLVGEQGHPVTGLSGAGAAYLVVLRENRPPVADAGPNRLVECDRWRRVTLDGSASSDPDGDPITFAWVQTLGPPVALSAWGATASFAAGLPGTYEFALTVTDAEGASATDTVQVTISDTRPPALALVLLPPVLWPPNHKLVDVSAWLRPRDACDAQPSVRLRSITSSEPDRSTGDGDRPFDIQGASYGTDNRRFKLRAERKGNGAGRVYTVTYEAVDASGNVASTAGRVKVPKSRSRH